jgi:hypothetical protein
LPSEAREEPEEREISFNKELPDNFVRRRFNQ